jgi:serine protease AprX
MFVAEKPDIAAYSHFFGNFGPGRPAGGSEAEFDSGTSAATPVAAGVGALLMSALGEIAPKDLKRALILSARPPGAGWTAETGFGVIDAAAALGALRSAPALVS